VCVSECVRVSVCESVCVLECVSVCVCGKTLKARLLAWN